MSPISCHVSNLHSFIVTCSQETHSGPDHHHHSVHGLWSSSALVHRMLAPPKRRLRHLLSCGRTGFLQFPSKKLEIHDHASQAYLAISPLIWTNWKSPLLHGSGHKYPPWWFPVWAQKTEEQLNNTRGYTYRSNWTRQLPFTGLSSTR